LIDEYIKRAKELGMEAMAVTDHGNMFGAIEFYQKALKKGIKPIIGMEAYIAETSMEEKSGKNFHLVLLAKNAKYWKQLSLPERTNLMVVLQGKTVNEIHLLYQTCLDLGYTHFAVNHSSMVYQELGGSENSLANQSVGRVMLIEYLKSQDMIKDYHYIHLLGASTPQEFTYYRDNHPNLINSVDTSNPIIVGALGQRYSDMGLLTKPSNKIEEFMEKDLAPQLEDIIFNVYKFKKFCNG
jgi:hypothetical protein